ncbi:conserved hypothetical protein [Acidianus hospitalis W1]|uniref:Thermopsin n=1 Tax=Acidianus hospitalis (strain W1) TaxID=933801 RepID=F4B5X7_ACIHW|nr:hypothetical protein [Acidianus hospitalis]AEE94475.1 conserved hypothetical protein [Acidianus hospitalis W1]
MRLLILLLLVSLLSIVSFSASISVQYPKEAFIGSKISINFTLTQQEINSTAFPFITAGVREISEKPLILDGIGCSFAIFKINDSSGELIITFVGKDNTSLGWNPGIVVYGGKFNPHIPDGQPGSCDLLLTFTGRLLVFLKTGWVNPISTLPLIGSPVNGWINVTKPFNYTAVLEDVNGSIFVKYVILNGEKYVVDYQTPIPWNFTYVGVRIDPSTLTVDDFCVYFTSPHQPYVVYVNGKEYAKGCTNCLGEGSVTLTVSSPSMVVNISFPLQHEYRVITISAQRDADVHVEYPVTQYALLGISVVLVVVSLLIERKRK